MPSSTPDPIPAAQVIPTYSHSQLQTFLQCPMKFKFRYLDRIATGIEGIEAFTGSRVHDALRKLFEEIIEDKFHSLSVLLEFYESRWKEKWHDGVRIAHPQKSKEEYFAHGQACIRNFYAKNQPFNQSQTLSVEKRVQFDLAPGRPRLFRGYVDRISTRPDGTLEIHDYKTSRTVPSRRELVDGVHKDSLQVSLYQIAVSSALPPSTPFELFLHYLSRGITYRLRRKPQSLLQILQDTNRLADRIESTQSFPAKKHRLCDWCEFQKICPEWTCAADVPL